MKSRDVTAWERGIWPAHARASSTFGGGWSPSSAIGPPRVYPRSGDIRGAWAPGPSRSTAEWLEVDFALETAVDAIRVFETNRAGSTYAVVDLTEGETLLFAAPPARVGGARVLEIPVTPARSIKRLRVYVANEGWAELDTVGLLAAEPLPEGQRTRVTLGASPSGCVTPFGCAASMAVIVTLAFAMHAYEGPDGASPTTLTRPALVAAGTTVTAVAPRVDAFAERGVVWASSVLGFSSEYASETNGSARVVGAPDVYPILGDLPRAWAPRGIDDGIEWISVRFPAPTSARGVVWVETLGPGAVVRIDDISDPAAPVVLFEGDDPSKNADGARVVEATLAAPRTISVLRLVLDTRRVSGWNELDAVGLVPAN